MATGRWGPLVTRQAHDVFAGGNIFPSGHTANAVVLYGVLAMVAARRWRPWLIGLAVWISVTVGLSTLYLDTHWLTDVLGGWLAGVVVLMVLPRCTDWILQRKWIPVSSSERCHSARATTSSREARVEPTRCG